MGAKELLYDNTMVFVLEMRDFEVGPLMFSEKLHHMFSMAAFLLLAHLKDAFHHSENPAMLPWIEAGILTW